MTSLRNFCAAVAATLMLCAGGAAFAQTDTVASRSQQSLVNWYRLVLELVRHTPTYSPPVASRAFAYIGVAGYEAVASGQGDMLTLAGQLNGLEPLAARDPAQVYDDAVVLDAALAAAAQDFFANTGPTGQRAMAAMAKSQLVHTAAGVDPGVVARLIRQQQKPLLPTWGNNRTFAMPLDADCGLPEPVAYSEDPTSDYYKQAVEVVETKANLTDEQKKIARFWSDDPMLSPTPPGHWISIALQILQRDGADTQTSVDVMARVGISVADAFIANWKTKYQYDTLRPISYIRKVMDPKWDALLITPPFPEFPSGHSTQSGAAAEVLTAIWRIHPASASCVVAA